MRTTTASASSTSAADPQGRAGRSGPSAGPPGQGEFLYTCLETIFLRISQSFENRLEPARRHNDLLRKMTLEVEGVRAAAVSEEAFFPLFELLKFRHFKRYYFDLESD